MLTNSSLKVLQWNSVASSCCDEKAFLKVDYSCLPWEYRCD